MYNKQLKDKCYRQKFRLEMKIELIDWPNMHSRQGVIQKVKLGDLTCEWLIF